MLKPVIAVKDTKIGAFDNPLTVRHVGEALREWETLTKDTNTKFGKHPQDFELYQIATYNEQNAEIVMLTPPVMLANGVM